MSENDNLHLPAEPPPAEQPDQTPDQTIVPFEQPPTPPKDEIFWGWHDFFVFVSVTILALAVAMLAGMGINKLLHISHARTSIVLVVAQFAAYGVAFAGLKLMFHAEYGEPLMKSLRWLPASIEPSRLMLVGLGQAFAIAIIGAFMRIPQMDTPMNRMMADRPTAIVIAVLGVTIAPLAEELAFRGLLQPLLIRSIGVVPGILVTSVLFGGMHLEQYGAWQSVVLITLAGVGFGAMRHYTGSTRASAIMHAGYNSALFLLFFMQKGAN